MSTATAVGNGLIDIELNELKYDLDDRTKEDLRAVEDLQANMASLGQLSPIIVEPKGEDGKYRIIGGKRRFHAAKALKWPNLKGIVWHGKENHEKVAVLSDNIFKRDVNRIQQGHIMKGLLDSGVFKNQTDMAKAFGISQAYVSTLLALTQEPDDIQQSIAIGELPMAAVKGSKKKKEKVAGSNGKTPKKSAKEVKSQYEADRWHKLKDEVLIPRNGERNKERVNIWFSKSKLKMTFVFPLLDVSKEGLVATIRDEIDNVGENNILDSVRTTLKTTE